MYKLPNVCLPLGFELKTLLFASRNEFHSNGCRSGMFLINIQCTDHKTHFGLLKLELQRQHTIPINVLSSRIAEKENQK